MARIPGALPQQYGEPSPGPSAPPPQPDGPSPGPGIPDDPFPLNAGTRRALETWRRTAQWLRELDGALRSIGLTHRQFFLLHAVGEIAAERGDAVSQREITDQLTTEAPATSKALRHLEDRGLVSRDVSALDARRWRILLTSAGEQVLREACVLVNALDS